ncbi:hypothetical protein PG997_012612 [Apiospora hydei]|uniref:Prolyl 4-hydroxylase alpha subunit domain-containing protein n=1 Tax=Apiospora hydei TaxID=1337664 RepID=A0ABR1V3V1_9PEZI
MSKSKKASKRKRDEQASAAVTKRKRDDPLTPLSPSPASDGAGRTTSATDAAPTSLTTVVSEEELELTVDTLRTLAEYPAIIKSKGCRDLRAAVYDFRQSCNTGTNTAIGDANLTAKISAALVDGKYTDALVNLAEMRIRNEAPKLGALCRWVRDLDVVSGLSLRKESDAGRPTIPRTNSQLELLRVLDSVLRVTGTMDKLPGILPSTPTEPIALQPFWDLRDTSRTPLAIRESVLDGSIFEGRPEGVKDKFRVLESTPGPERKPPNLHDAVLYLSEDDAVPLAAAGPTITYHHHPAVPNLSLMKDVLSPEECRSIIASTEAVGFLPDAPIRDDGSETSVLAHNVYWMIDQAFHDKLWSRVAPFLPSQVDGRKARSINRRFRVYRYVPGAEYRCHFDGAWPPSGINATTGKYMWDASPADAKQSSLFTFLVYLNDEFEGGETTFFTPSPVEGVVNAHPVRPTQGAIALFPTARARVLYSTKEQAYDPVPNVEYDVDAK